MTIGVITVTYTVLQIPVGRDSFSKAPLSIALKWLFWESG